MMRASGEPPAASARGAGDDSPSALADGRMAASPGSPTGLRPVVLGRPGQGKIFPDRQYVPAHITYTCYPVRHGAKVLLITLDLVETGPNLLIQAFGFMRICETVAELESLACDCECFFAHETAAFARAKSSCHVAYLVVLVIVHAIEAGWVDG